VPATLTAAQLQSALLAGQIDAARTLGMEAADSFDPVAEEIAAACARVDAYAAGWLPGAALLTGWSRDIAAWSLAKRLGEPSASQTAARDRALKELEDLRDGKFRRVPRDGGASPAGASLLAYGGREALQ
jgi:hypothetical protein